jgi:hypothetical protein
MLRVVTNAMDSSPEIFKVLTRLIEVLAAYLFKPIKNILPSDALTHQLAPF